MGFEIQPDDVLYLTATIKTCHIKTILEFGGLDGFSARVFCEAGARVWSIDVNPFSIDHPSHTMITKNIADLQPDEIGQKIDMVFFDAHCYKAQTDCLERFKEAGLITDETLLVFHDTGGSCIHQISERLMVNDLLCSNYSCLHIKTERGLSVCCKTPLLDIL
jgi:predicted O-methyltransferase YrrM